MSIGYLTFERHCGPLENGRIKITHADPVIEAQAEFLEELFDSPYARFHDKDYVDFIGCNRTVTYRICEHNFQRNTYTLRWPD